MTHLETETSGWCQEAGPGGQGGCGAGGGPDETELRKSVDPFAWSLKEYQREILALVLGL